MINHKTETGDNTRIFKIISLFSIKMSICFTSREVFTRARFFFRWSKFFLFFVSDKTWLLFFAEKFHSTCKLMASSHQIFHNMFDINGILLVFQCEIISKEFCFRKILSLLVCINRKTRRYVRIKHNNHSIWSYHINWTVTI